uniref:Uncharacterized protein n=1 Tax=Palpitomonas bilix TaxID=652834 RepID=A0A7S3DG92_9EUKA|mmetsp:Transcript_36248/g.94293  ORF Transcript_36248/g.94293 Transcript_36248/m.94293 type:complete len:116 (+) Transcript_36248:126-473(+)
MLIAVYDVSRRGTFESLDHWLNEIEENAGSAPVKLVVGNKIDKNREVQTKEGRKFAVEHGSLFIEASAKTRQNIDEAFEELVEKILQTPGFGTGVQSSLSVASESNVENGGGCGC